MRSLLLVAVAVVLSLGCGDSSVKVADGGVKVEKDRVVIEPKLPNLPGEGGENRTKKTQLPSVAVLVVKVPSNTSSKLYQPCKILGETLGANVTKLLSRYPELDVKAQSAVREWSTYSPMSAGRQLGVKNVLITEIKAQEDTIIVTVELMELPDARQPWSEVYREKFTSAEQLAEFEEKITKEIATAVAEKLGAKVKKSEGGKAK